MRKISVILVIRQCGQPCRLARYEFKFCNEIQYNYTHNVRKFISRLMLDSQLFFYRHTYACIWIWGHILPFNTMNKTCAYSLIILKKYVKLFREKTIHKTAENWNIFCLKHEGIFAMFCQHNRAKHSLQNPKFIIEEICSFISSKMIYKTVEK